MFCKYSMHCNFEPQLQNNDIIQCIVPSWRNDVYREIDLIEEFARMYGYDKIRTEQKISIEVAPVDRSPETNGPI